MNGIKLLGTGKYVPQNVVTNDDLAQRMDTSDQWISTRTGIRQRCICQEETQAALCTEAARRALERSGISPDEIGACIVATITPECLTPSTACLIQKSLGLSSHIPCFDLNAACTGFVAALHTMECLLNASDKKYGLVIGGEALSHIVDWEDRSSCILFGDGAGAAVVECREGWPSIGAYLGAHGNDQFLFAPGPGGNTDGFLQMEGTKVFKFAVETVPYCIDRVLMNHKLSMEDVDQFVFHQANARIIDSVMKKTGIPAEKCHKNLQNYGNTSAASIPLLLSELEENGTLHPGDRCLLVGFGGGLTWGGALIEYIGGRSNETE